jgi:hypothetical protein
MSQFQLEIFEEPTGKDFRNLVDAPIRKLMSPFVPDTVYKQTSLLISYFERFLSPTTENKDTAIVVYFRNMSLY